MTIPDSLPTLSKGSHRRDSGRACVMEYVSLLAGEQWSDEPSCTHPLLAAAARVINDNLPDDERHILVPRIGRLFGTTEDVNLFPWLMAFQAIGDMRPGSERGGQDAVWASDDDDLGLLAGWVVEDASDSLAVFDALIDEYDRLSGRTEYRELAPHELADLARQVSA